ncbi:DUF4932 domain-containing protein [Clostridium perfringens]|nr:DUF4932 domain-containing protein [Clostridium perfringens]
MICNLIFHELSHSIINPITEKNSELVNKHKGVYEEFEKYKTTFCG